MFLTVTVSGGSVGATAEEQCVVQCSIMGSQDPACGWYPFGQVEGF